MDLNPCLRTTVDDFQHAIYILDRCRQIFVSGLGNQNVVLNSHPSYFPVLV